MNFFITLSTILGILRLVFFSEIELKIVRKLGLFFICILDNLTWWGRKFIIVDFIIVIIASLLKFSSKSCSLFAGYLAFSLCNLKKKKKMSFVNKISHELIGFNQFVYAAERAAYEA